MEAGMEEEKYVCVSSEKNHKCPNRDAVKVSYGRRYYAAAASFSHGGVYLPLHLFL